MVKTKIEKIASIQEEIKQLKERQKLLQQQHNAQERKDRTRRLCRRMGLFESMFPDTISLTDEQFKIFLERITTTEQSRRILKELIALNDNNSPQKSSMPGAQYNESTTAPVNQSPRENGIVGIIDWGEYKK